MNIKLKLSTNEDAQTIKNLWSLYQHDVSEFDGAVPNQHGIFNDDEKVNTLEKHFDSLNPWWSDPASLFPYLILVNGSPAGFNLIAARARLPKEIQADFVVHEFFVLHAYRGSPVAQQAAIKGFDKHKGKWEVVTYPSHLRAITFWRRVIGQYTSMKFTQEELDHPWGRRVAFRFDNSNLIFTNQD